MTASFQELLQRFFVKWLIDYRNASPCTIAAYSDSFRLLIGWFANKEGVCPDKITFDDIKAVAIMRFANYLESERSNSAKTINCRIAAIKSFAEFISYEEPALAAWAHGIKGLPLKKTKKPLLDFLSAEEVSLIMASCNTATSVGRRDQLIIRLLFNSGARISEVITLRVASLEFQQGKCYATFNGKGRKARRIPLWRETAEALSTYIEEHSLSIQDWLFPGRNVDHLTRSGARSLIERHTGVAKSTYPEILNKVITPHVFRHSTAMALLESGVNLSTIAIWLGHESITTTHKYMVASMELKQKALSTVCGPSAKAEEKYQADTSIIEFLKLIAR